MWILGQGFAKQYKFNNPCINLIYYDGHHIVFKNHIQSFGVDDWCVHYEQAMKNTSLPLTLEEFKNITNLLFSQDKECRILAKKILFEFAQIDEFKRIWLTPDYWIKPYLKPGWYQLSTGTYCGPRLAYEQWEKSHTKNFQQQ